MCVYLQLSTEEVGPEEPKHAFPASGGRPPSTALLVRGDIDAAQRGSATSAVLIAGKVH